MLREMLSLYKREPCLSEITNENIETYSYLAHCFQSNSLNLASFCIIKYMQRELKKA
jgi:hypothetical protein